MSASFIATMLDQEMLECKRGVTIYPRTTPTSALPLKTGKQVAKEIGNRYLLRYLLRNQIGMFASGSTAEHYVTPTPYGRNQLTGYLALPNPGKQRTFVLVLDPDRIALVKGPRWVRAGSGIEYILQDGFSADAIAFKAIGPTWEIEIR